MENINNTDTQTISLMTMHGAKGLEFDYVFLAGWEEGVFPSQRSLDELGNKGLEEERRLAYVAITRARKKIQISYVNQNRYSFASHDFNSPSRFISELPKELIEVNAAIRNHPVEDIGAYLRESMTAMTKIVS